MLVGIIGAGTMGSGIAQAFAACEGFSVKLTDINNEFAAGGKAKIEKALSGRVAKGKMTQEAADANPDSKLNELIAENGKVSGKTAFEAMRAGDKAGKEVVDMYIDYLADGLANAINTFMPEILVVGGGVCGEGDPLLIPMREKTMSRPYFGPGVPKTRVELAQMGNDAGIVGAAMMGKSCVDDGKNGK